MISFARAKTLKKKVADLELALADLSKRLSELTSRLGFDINQIPASTAPSIFINTIPKSGSVFLEAVLRSVTGHTHLILGTGTVPNDAILIERAKLFARGGFIAQQHADASPNNLALLEKYVGRWIVHLRDPRSVILSWTHHMDKLAADGHADLFDFSGPIPDETYLARTFSGRLDWQIDNLLPSLVQWSEAWVRYADAKRGQVLLTTFEDMVADEQVFIRRIAAFFKISVPRYLNTFAYKTEAMHYRKGETDEWKRVFTMDQQQRALATIPNELAARMKWPRG